MRQYQDIIARAQSAQQHIVLPEGLDERVVEGAVLAARNGVAKTTLLGPVEQVRRLTRGYGDTDDKVQIVDPAMHSGIDDYAAAYFRLRQHKGTTLEDAYQAVTDNLVFADLMVHLGEADGSVAGATRTTSDVVRHAIQIIGVDPRYSMVSSFFIMMACEPHHPVKGGVVFSDCALVVEPSSEELTEIAEASARSARALLGTEPRIAMLSFSTKGSANHPNVEKVETACARLKEKAPHLEVDGAMQFDAAIIPSIAKQKAKDSTVAGRANVFVFPDLNSGNIGYKIAERIGAVRAIGPILQGLARPANDLSRGCDSEAVYGMIAVTSVQAAETKDTNLLSTRVAS